MLIRVHPRPSVSGIWLIAPQSARFRSRVTDFHSVLRPHKKSGAELYASSAAHTYSANPNKVRVQSSALSPELMETVSQKFPICFRDVSRVFPYVSMAEKRIEGIGCGQLIEVASRFLPFSPSFPACRRRNAVG